MINLYQILNISPYATDAQIRVALQHYQNQTNADPKVVQATAQWLLTPDVRQRYDARLQAEQPAFFQAAKPRQDPSHVIIEDDEPETNEYDYDDGYDDGYVPRLWNPKAAAIWAFFLPPAMGSWLHAQNWRELGNEKLYKHNLNLTWIFIAAAFAFVFLNIFTGIDLGIVGNLTLWAFWFFTVGKKQIDFVRDEVGDDYDRKPWGKVIGMVILLFIGFIVAVMILMFLAVIAGVAHPSLFE